jgi:undecaprenyl-diphosphatase
MTWWQAALLGLLQGLTEFLPVSSSGHLVLAQYFFGLDESLAREITFEVFVHFGTTLSILTVYRKRVLSLFAETWKALRTPGAVGSQYQESVDFRIVVYILLSIIPTAIVYVQFKDQLEAAFADPRLVCVMLCVTGFLLLLTQLRKQPSGEMSVWRSLLTGLAQAAAMIPGISRSGATICTAIYTNVEREQAADFSFLMVLPVIIGATALKAIEMFEVESVVGVIPLLLGTLVAYLSGIWAIKVVIGFVKRGRLQVFAFYCFLVGIAGLIFIQI